MKTLQFSELTANELKTIAHITEKRMAPYPWTDVQHICLSDKEKNLLTVFTEWLLYENMSIMNEATIWSRAIYPMLILAEQGDVRAWSQVSIRVQYPHVELQGTIDGVLGTGIASLTGESYYMIVVEAKRGLEAQYQDPRPQLYGQMLATAHLNWEHNQEPVQELFGCYTISDTWTFARAEVKDIDTDAPTMTVEFSREYSQRIEGETIVKILKGLIGRYL